MTARLSKLFYERVGEQVANELVEWFNAVDATYRADLKELNELNFARFDAKVEQRLAELRSHFENKLAAMDAKLEQRMTELRSHFETKLAVMDAKLEKRLAELEAKLERRLGDQTRLIFAAWATLMVAIIGFGLR